MHKELKIYKTQRGISPFIEWFESLKDMKGRAHIINRLDRVAVGHYGDCKLVGNGVFELRIHYGPGYRVYFREQGNTIVLLLVGGSKRTQKQDIKNAKAFLAELQERLIR